MAPVIDKRAELDTAVAGFSASLAQVVSITPSGTPGAPEYRYRVGFVVFAPAGRGEVFVCVSKKLLVSTKLKKKASFGVRFYNHGHKGPATFHSNHLDYLILKVSVQEHVPAVAFGDVVRNSELILICKDKADEWNTYSTTVIIPQNDACAFDGGRPPSVALSEDFFTMGFPVLPALGFDKIDGAPVFDMHGLFVGLVHSFATVSRDNTLNDVVFVRRAVRFGVPECMRV